MVLMLLALQAAPQNPDLLYKKEIGFSMMKPPKNEEWGFPEKGFFQGSAAVAAHKVDTLTIDVYCQDKAGGFSYYDPKDAADQAFKSLSTMNGVTDATRQPSKPSKLPGGGAGGVNCHIVDMAFKLEGTAKELKMWNFVGKENQNFYRITLVGDEGMYKKHQKQVDYILSTVRIWKLPK